MEDKTKSSSQEIEIKYAVINPEASKVTEKALEIALHLRNKYTGYVFTQLLAQNYQSDRYHALFFERATPEGLFKFVIGMPGDPIRIARGDIKLFANDSSGIRKIEHDTVYEQIFEDAKKLAKGKNIA